jgi:Flp pilus assembly protein TadG
LCPKKTRNLAQILGIALKILCKTFRVWVAAKDAATAIEFSMLCMPFLMLMLGTFELAMMYASASLLENAAGQASRIVRTGQLQQSGSADPESVFRVKLCETASILVPCNDIRIESVPMGSYYDFSDLAPQYDEDGNMISRGFNAGGSDDTILIRVSYRYSMMTPFIAQLLLGPTGSRLLMSTIVLQTEPYDFGEAAGV